jgi:hypothetical protein
MNPILYLDFIYSYSRMKKEEDGLRNFLFEYTETITRQKRSEIETATASFESENSFLYQLLKVSDNGRNYSQQELNDHVGTLIVAVRFKSNRKIITFIFYKFIVGRRYN